MPTVMPISSQFSTKSSITFSGSTILPVACVAGADRGGRGGAQLTAAVGSPLVLALFSLSLSRSLPPALRFVWLMSRIKIGDEIGMTSQTESRISFSNLQV